MRIIRSILVFFGVVILGYFLVSYAFPKSASRYPFLVMILLFDLYLWSAIKKKVFAYRKSMKITIAGLYWLPFVLMSISLVIASFMNPVDWNKALRTYLFGGIFTVYAAKLVPVIFLFITDFIRLFQGIKTHRAIRNGAGKNSANGLSRSGFLTTTGLALGGLMLGTMFTGMFKWVYDFRVKTIKMPIPNLPESFEGLKIIQISDIHLGSWGSTSMFQQAIEMINSLNADLVLFTGDLVNVATEEAFRFREQMKQLQAKDGVFAVLGNHDYGDYMNWESAKAKQENMKALYELYDQVGWKLLRNEHHYLEKNGDKLAIVGVENWSAIGRFPKYGKLARATEGVSNETVQILMSHDPSHWEAEVLKKYPAIDLTLSGHTHGFQFGIEIPGLKWSPAQYMYKQWAGLYEDPNTKQMLYVNRGLGSIGYPGRIGILPEITLFELQSA